MHTLSWRLSGSLENAQPNSTSTGSSVVEVAQKTALPVRAGFLAKLNAKTARAVFYRPTEHAKAVEVVSISSKMAIKMNALFALPMINFALLVKIFQEFALNVTPTSLSILKQPCVPVILTKLLMSQLKLVKQAPYAHMISILIPQTNVQIALKTVNIAHLELVSVLHAFLVTIL